MWISIEQSVKVSGIVYVFLGFVVVIGHVQLSLLIMGPHPGIDNYRAFNDFADFGSYRTSWRVNFLMKLWSD